MKKLITRHDPVFTWALHPYQLYEYGLDAGISDESILQYTGLSKTQIQDLGLHINWKQYGAMSLNFEEHGPSDWCFQFGKRLSIASHGMFSLLALNCTTWRQAIEDIQKYSVLINPIFFVELEENDEYVFISAHPEFVRDKILDKHYEGYFTTLYQAIFQMGASNIDAIRDGITLFLKAPPPSYQNEIKDFFNGSVQWNHHSNQLRVKKELVDLSIPNANPVYAEQTRRQLQAQLSRLRAQHGILRELRNLFTHQQYSLEKCAKALHTSTPTLKRMLKEAGTTFSQELSQYRIEEACHLALFDSDTSDTAEKLGFLDTNSFSRLFKKETGYTFSQYKNHLAKPL